MAVRVDRDVIAADGRQLSHDRRFFLTALDPDQVTAAGLLAAVRAHWQVENSLFFGKDRWWDEDRHWTRRPGLSAWLAQLTSAAMTVLRACCPPQQPLRAHADAIAWNPRRGLQLLGTI